MIRIKLSDGSMADFDTDDPQSAINAARRIDQMKASRLPSLGVMEDFPHQTARSLGVGDELAGAAGYVSQGAENIVRRLQGKPIDMPARDAYLAGSTLDKMEGARIAQQRPILNTAAGIAGFLTAGKPGIGPGMTTTPITNQGILKTGTQTATISAPFAIAQQNGDLWTRAKKAVPVIATAGGLGMLAQGAANGLGAIASTSKVAQKAKEFEEAGVRATMAALNSGETNVVSPITQMIAENFWAGGNARRNLRNSVDDTASAASRLSNQAGEVTSPLLAGERIRAGATAWGAPGGTFRTKATQLYDKALAPIADKPAAATNSEQVLNQIAGRIKGPASAEMIIPRQLQKIRSALENDRGSLTLSDLREWRSWVRLAQDDPNLAQTIDNASLQRLEGALTQDIYTAAAEHGGPEALRGIQRADQYYGAGVQRIKKALAPFADPRGHGASAYERVISLAGSKGNTRALVSLKRSLSGDDWSNVRATILSRLGAPKAGAANALEDGAFSIDNFVTNYAQMSPEGRAALFGSYGGGGAHAAEIKLALDRLANVAAAQKGVAAMANRSRSGVTVQNVATNPLNPAAWPYLMGASLTGEMLTNPAFVRWLASAPKAGGQPGGAIAHARLLESLVSKDPALLPAYDALIKQISPHSAGQSPGPEAQPSRKAAGM